MASKKKPKIRTVKDLKNKLKIDFVSSEVLNRKDEKNRINYILEVVKDGTILVTDGVMNPDEELSLIRETMRRVDSGFPGIEVCSLKRETRGYQRLLENIFDQRYTVEKLVSRITGRSEPRMDMKYGMTLIGPSKFIKDIKKNPDSFSVLTEMQK
jgi:hypothetical protein